MIEQPAVSPARVTVTIACWNGKAYLKACLESVLAQTWKDIEIILVDDGSSDGSADFVQQNFPSVAVLRNKSNGGFCKTQNRGIREATGAYILPLNQDVILTPPFVDEAVKAIESNPKIGSISGKLLRTAASGPNPIIDSVGHSMSVDRIPGNRGWHEVDTGQYDTPGYIFGSRGAAPLYRRAMVQELMIDGELFDEDFVAYYDDVDVDWRAQLLGWKCYYTPEAIAYHVSGTSRDNLRKTMEIHEIKNRYLMILKNDSPANILRDVLFIGITEIRRFLYVLLGHWPLFKGYLQFLRLAPRALRKRRIVMDRKKVSDPDLRKWFVLTAAHVQRIVESFLILYALIALFWIVPAVKLISIVAGYFLLQWGLTTGFNAIRPRAADFRPQP